MLLALVYVGTCGSMLYFQWLQWLVMELEFRYVGVLVGTCGYIWVWMGTLGCLWLGNDSTWWLALVYGGTCGSMLYFQWLWWLVMELKFRYVGVLVGTCGYIWVCMGTLGCVWLGNDSTWWLALVYGDTCGSMLYFQWLRWLVMELEFWYVGVLVGTCGYIWVWMGTLVCVWLGNDSTWWLALVYGGTCGSVLNFQWLQWVVMELEIGTWGYLWVCVHTYGCGWVP
jgi:hypothetical protein